MNTSCGEFGLRIALCDLIERLKRCEHKCSYLEQCRHELIREVMRLRLENEWLSNTCLKNNLMTDSNQLALNSNNNHNSNTNSSSNNSYNINNKIIMRSVNNELKVENKSVDKPIVSDLIGTNVDNNDESWQQITVRLLQDLRRDVLKGQTGDGQLSYDLPLNPDIMETIESNERQTNTTNNDTIITINDSLSQLNDNLIDDKNQLTNNREVKTLSAKGNGGNGGNNLCSNNEYNKSSYLYEISDKKVFNNRSERGAEEQNSDPKRNANNSAPNECNPPIDRNIESINAFCNAMSYVKTDLNEVLQALTTQNEKLNRLKAKQLRNFFKRQINFDQNSYQTSTPLKAELKSNYENC